MRNVDVLELAQINPIETFVGTNTLRSVGHVSQMPEHRAPKYLLDWKPAHGKRSTGRSVSWRTQPFFQQKETSNWIRQKR